MSLCLFNVIRERHELKQINYDDKIRRIDFYFNKIVEIKMNQYKRFYKRFNKSLKCLSRDIVKNKQFTLFFLFISFKHFRQELNNFNIKSYKMFIKICEF